MTLPVTLHLRFVLIDTISLNDVVNIQLKIKQIPSLINGLGKARKQKNIWQKALQCLTV